MIEIPKIVFKGVPSKDPSKDKDRHDLWLLNLALSGIERYASNFGAALHLFDYCLLQQSILPASSHTFTAWQFVAARDAVMSINHFMKAMISANDLANTSH